MTRQRKSSLLVAFFLFIPALLAFLLFTLLADISVIANLAVSLLVGISAGAASYYRRGCAKQSGEISVLKGQMEKSALIISKLQDKYEEVGKRINLLNENILLSKQQLESSFDAISDSICIVNPDLSIQRVNRSFSNSVNIPFPDILGRKCYHIFWKSQKRCANCPAGYTFKTGKKKRSQHMTRQADNRVFHYEVSTYPIMDKNNKVVNVIEYIHDVTEQRILSAQLIRSEKLASIGVMTAGIAHEMNNPLSGISGNATNMLEMPEKYGLNSRGVNRVNTILEASGRANRIMRDLLDLSRRHEAKFIFVDINKIVNKALTSIHLPGYNKIKKAFNPDEGLSPIKCDPDKIEQVLVNVFTNAYNALIDRFGSNVETLNNNELIERGKIEASTEKAGNTIVISVLDNGIGISEDTIKYIFDPFFTTRQPGKGTGLGLSVSNKIIEEHGGKIWVESDHSGTKFYIEIPSLEDEKE